MSDYRLFLDGKEVTSDVKDLNKVKLTVALDSDQEVVEYGTVSSLEVTGSTAKIIDDFVSGCSSLEKEMPAELVVNTADCGIIKIPLVVNARGSKCCPSDCKAYISLSTSNSDTQAKEKLDRTLYYENGFTEAFNHPRIGYCDQQSDFLYAILYTIRQILATVLLPLFFIVKALVAFVVVICEAVNLIPLVNIDCPDFQFNPIGDLFELIDGFLTGCGRYVHCPLLREIFEYQAAQCGLTLKSSTLQNLGSPRYDSCIACLDIEQGVSCDKDVNWQEGNQPLTTVLELMKMYAQMINGKVRIINGCIYIERKDFFDRFQGELADLNQVGTTSGDEEICYSYDLEELCASDKIEYCEDSEEKEGKKVQRNYRKFKTYVTGTATNLRKKCETVLPFSPSRFMFDEASFERNGFLDFDATQDDFRDGGFSLFGNQAKITDSELLLSGSKMSKCKILALTPGFDRKHATVVRSKIGERKIGPLSSTKSFYTYNEPWKMEALCKDFFNINDPNIGSRPLLQVEGIKIRMTCQAVNQLLDRNIQAALKTHKGVGLADGWTICFEECSIDPEGAVRVYC